MGTMLNLLFITIIIVYCIDYCGFVQEISKSIWKVLFKGLPYKGWVIPKPFSCSVCLSFWVGLLYIVITGFSWKMLAFVCLLSWAAPTINDIMILFRDTLVKINDKLYE